MRRIVAARLQDSSGAALTAQVAATKVVLGQVLALKYDGTRDWQEAMAICATEGPDSATRDMTWVLLTPDGEQVTETLDGSAAGPAITRVLEPMGDRPADLLGKVYRFR